MTEIVVTKEDLLKNIELDCDSLIQELAEDICKGAPDWWAEQICKPLLPYIQKQIEDSASELLKGIVSEVYNNNYRTIERQVDNILDEVVRERAEEYVKKLLKGLHND